MRARRVLFTLRWLMLAVLVMALAFGWLARWNARRLRRQALMAEARVQSQVTTALIREVAAALPFTGPQASEGGGLSSSPDEVRWTKSLKVWDVLDVNQPPVIDVAISGGGGTGLEPISIRDNGGAQGKTLLDPLVRAYRQHGWAFTLESRAGPGPGRPTAR